MFEKAPLNPPDAIFGLSEEFKRDPNPDKINLTVGVYQDEQGKTPVMQVVQEAERRMLADCPSKSYLPIDGSPTYREAIGRLILGDALYDSPDCHAATAQTPGGTGALRIAGEVLRRVFKIKTIWVSNPTWANHQNIFAGAGMDTVEYKYLDDAGTGLGFKRLIDSLGNAESGQAVLLHTVCHNPTGVDPDQKQWRTLFELIRVKGLIPVFDFAYQGFGESLDDDAFPIREFVSSGFDAIVCNSFSKNFVLFAERVGGVTAICSNPDACEAMQSQLKRVIRMMYSNPPMHGGAIVAQVLQDSQLRAQWVEELAEIRNRIAQLRQNFVTAMKQRLPDLDFEYIVRQRGMFSYSGLTAEQVKRLKEDYSIYALGSGRINVAGINASNLDRLCDAIAAVMSVTV